MELSEMIKIMQHYENGGEVEYSEDGFKTIFGKANNKKNPNGLSWDWSSLQYRIKEQKQKVTIEKLLLILSYMIDFTNHLKNLLMNMKSKLNKF